jgi:hypothetical protein
MLAFGPPLFGIDSRLFNSTVSIAIKCQNPLLELRSWYDNGEQDQIEVKAVDVGF